ncbi:PD-(D/E)XK nuclease family protein [Teredinibacter turnerae]|uniref:PD-(D/E)XK nuclease family protein n=1 Tax=Teredinibacter turnerae TaxID=2426 RepID=UPI0004234F71|nr:PD-(D/E)XK nuclease family protein [Teredinibacter turnerae]
MQSQHGLSALLHEHFSGDLPANGLVLTPNERLSRFVQTSYGDFQRAQGKTAFANLWCRSYQGWLQDLWQRLTLDGRHPRAAQVLMTPQQEMLLWETVITSHPDTPPLLNSVATAKNAQDAWRLVCEWALPIDSFETDELLQSHQLFLAWVAAFNEQCQQRGLLTFSELSSVICDALMHSDPAAAVATWRLPKQIVMYGFDDQAPALLQLLEALAGCGCQMTHVAEPEPTPQVSLCSFSDPQAELESVATWCYQEIAAQPVQQIGVVIPDLSARRAEVERHFNRVFDPHSILPTTPQHAPGFNMSAGQPLAQVPVMQAALQALQLNRARLELETASALLLSPFLGIQSELAARALLDVRLREQGELSPSRQLLRTSAAEFCDDEGLPLCEHWYHALDGFDKLAKQYGPSARLPSEWLPVFMAQLQCLGWPGDRTLDTLEYQQVQVWQTCLDEFAALDVVTAPMAWSEALSLLRRLLQQRSFQPQTRISPVQILGSLEAAGLPFDQLWIMGLDDEAWPPAPSPNPLLPLAVQVAHNTPQSSAEREYRYARNLTQRWLASASQVRFSYAATRDDKQLQPSPLVQAFAQTREAVPLFTAWEQLQWQTRDMESIEDTNAGEVADVQCIRGGAAILRDQAACPFQAFARHRLRASEVPEVVLGLDAAERGNLLHHTMEIVWRKLGDQAGLLAQSDESLLALVDEAIADALRDIRRKSFVGFRFVELETRRLAGLVCAWLELEKQRAPFKVVFNESRKDLTLAGLPLSVRYDRVDALADGGLFVIDYKTGLTAVKSWEGERPDQPQVPLYAIANREKVVAAAFAQINSREIALKGLADVPDVAPGLKHPADSGLDLPVVWKDLLAHWQQTLEQLASDFLAGEAAVAPKVPGSTCRYCELKGFCRIRSGTDDEEDAP